MSRTSATATVRARGPASPMSGAPGMSAAGAAAAPAFRLPGSHFVVATLYLLGGALLLMAFVPPLARGDFLAPGVAALTHFFTLGWITTSIMGALYQFLPVALGRPIRSEAVAYATLLLYAPGLLAFVAGVGGSRPWLMLPGAAILGIAVLLFMGNLGATLWRAPRRDVTWWALALATLFLGITLVLGLALTGNLRWGYLGVARLTALGVHLHVALAGWVLLVMIGVGHRLLPMFLLSHGAGDRFAKAAVALVATGAGMLAVLHHASPVVGRWLPAALIGLGCGAFLLQARAFYAHRHRRLLDPGMRLAAGALLLLALALCLAFPVVFGIAAPRVAVAYVMAGVLGISLFVAAHYYKIVPFLVWYHRFGPLAGRRPVPRVSELYSARVATAAAALLAAGALMLVVAVASGSETGTRIGSFVFASGALVQAVQMLLLWRLRP